MSVPSPQRRERRWHIFCRVVDNFGDIAVCWRLARVLAREHVCQVSLVVDRPELLQRIAPTHADFRRSSNGGAIRVVRWSSKTFPREAADVVIEAFGCDLPEDYVAGMLSGARPPLWINLEYLSAEDWVSACHRLPSRHPRLGIDKFFFFPGFEPRSGGLLREADLFARRDRFRASPGQHAALWSRLGLPPPQAGERRASLFGYENRALPSLLHCLSSGERRWTLLVPEGRSVAGVAQWFDVPAGRPGDAWTRGRLHVRVLPFTDQDAYDELLWACDLNLVRGEDSLVRALWAGRALLWQLYPQAEEAHLVKLEAFLALIAREFAEPAAAQVVADLMRAWNRGAEVGAAWPRFEDRLGAIGALFDRWSAGLGARPELATALVHFSETQLK